MKKRSTIVMYFSVVVMASLGVYWHVNPYLILLLAAAIGLAVTLTERAQARQVITPPGWELGEPFRVEVMLDDVPVAILTDRRFVEMFWRDYRIEPVSEETTRIVHDDELWNQCRFTFRDPVTKVICKTGFAGGTAPFVRDGQVSLRGLYFVPADAIAKPLAA